MSRSYRKIPIFGITSSKNQKDFRSQENRAKRREVKIRLQLEQELPHEKEYGNEWSSPRDGKCYWANCDKKSMRK